MSGYPYFIAGDAEVQTDLMFHNWSVRSTRDLNIVWL